MSSAPARRTAKRRPLDLFGGGLGEAALDGGRDADLAAAAGRRVDELDQPDRRDVELAGIVDRDGQQVVAHAEPGERIDPRVAGEVRHDGHEAASLADHGDAVDGAGEVGAAEALGRRR